MTGMFLCVTCRKVCVGASVHISELTKPT